MEVAAHMQALPRLDHTLYYIRLPASTLTPSTNNITITTSVVTKEIEEKKNNKKMSL